jgi:hypothetical protein
MDLHRAPVFPVAPHDPDTPAYRKESTMKRSRISLATLVFVSAATVAQAAPQDDLASLAAQSGLRERELRMLAGAPSAFAEYRTSYRALSRRAADRGLDLRSLAVIDRHARELDRAAALAIRFDARPVPVASVAVR